MRRTCEHCDAPLTGKQRRFCSDAHKRRHYRRNPVVDDHESIYAARAERAQRARKNQAARALARRRSMGCLICGKDLDRPVRGRLMVCCGDTHKKALQRLRKRRAADAVATFVTYLGGTVPDDSELDAAWREYERWTEAGKLPRLANRLHLYDALQLK